MKKIKSFLSKVNNPSTFILIAAGILLAAYIATLPFLIGNRKSPSEYTEIAVEEIAENFEYSINEGEVTIDKYKGTAENLAIPAVIDEKPVVTIGREAFMKSKIKSVKIPDSVLYIRNSAFASCKSLEKVVFPSDLKQVGVFAFYDCTSLTKVSLPDTVESLGVSAFSMCESLKEVNIPASIAVINKATFRSTAIEKIVIPEGVKIIMPEAFANCPSLKTIKLPESLESVYENSFDVESGVKWTVKNNSEVEDFLKEAEKKAKEKARGDGQSEKS